MRKNFSERENKLAKRSYLTLASVSLRRTLSDDELLQEFAAFVRFSSEQDFKRRYPELLRIPEVREAVCPTRTPGKRLISRERIEFHGDKKLLFHYASIFKSNSSSIRSFCAAKARFELALLNGSYESARTALEEIRSTHGESLWTIRNTITLEYLAGRPDEMEIYSQKTKESVSDAFVSFFINQFILLASDPLLHINRSVQGHISELTKANAVSWADFVSLVLMPSPGFSKPRELKCLALIQMFPLVDQYQLLSGLLANNIVVARSAGNKAANESDALRSIRAQGRLEVESLREEHELVSAYERGDYSEVVRHFSDHIQKSSALLHLLPLVAKSIIQDSSIEWVPAGLLKEALDSYGSILALDPNPAQYISKLRAQVVKLHGSDMSGAIHAALHGVAPHYYSAVDRKFSAEVSLVRLSSESTWLSTLASSEDVVLDHRYQENTSELPRLRQIKSFIRDDSVSADDARVRELLNEFRDGAGLARDYYELASSVLCEAQNLDELLVICADALSTNAACFTAFPLARLVSYVEENAKNTIDAAIVVYYYVRYMDKSKEYLLNETYEDLLYTLDVARPSDLTSIQVKENKLAVLLRDVSSVDTMDFLTCFGKSDEVGSERIKILDSLKNMGFIDEERYQVEVDELIEKLIVDSAATEVSVHKIAVNDAAIKRSLLEDVESLMRVHRAASDDSQVTYVRFDSDSESSVAQAVVAGDKNTALLKLYGLVKSSFLFDEKGGLAKSLSAEIRHGFFSNLMRSRVEGRMLITESDENGVYSENRYWKEANALLKDDTAEQIDACLRKFSASFNELIAEAEEWMKVTIEHDDVTKVFGYATYAHEFSPLRDALENAKNAEEAIDLCLDVLWQRTEQLLAEMRERINVDLRQGVDEVFDQLKLQLDEVRGSVALDDLVTAIRLAKNEVREDISTVSEWFRRAGSPTAKSYQVNRMVDVSAECYARVRGRPIYVDNQASALSDVNIDGEHMKPFVISLLNLFENAVRHSGFGVATRVVAEGRRSGGGWSLFVRNEVADTVRNELRTTVVPRIRSAIKAPVSPTVLHSERGTGLGKVRNQLGTVSEKFSLDVDVVDDKFSVEIRHG